jgi:hypothetical protein
VCPNCHAVIHLGGGCRSIEQVKELLVTHSRMRQREIGLPAP